MKKEVEITRLVLPEWALPYLINGDLDNISDDELKELKDFEKRVCVVGMPDFEPYFAHRNEINNLGATCYDCPCIFRESFNQATK